MDFSAFTFSSDPLFYPGVHRVRFYVITWHYDGGGCDERVRVNDV